ncbi:MAG: MlaD family protein, partial [Mycobacterium sp.]|nr:MlaD family protein [Mycobacterium sp.]
MARAVTFYDDPPHRTAGLVLLTIIGVLATLVFLLFRGDLSATTTLTVESGRSGLVLDRGAKVTYNGVAIGRVSAIEIVQRDGVPSAVLTAEVGSQYLAVMPANVRADVRASTIFGNKYLDFTAPRP